MRSILSLFSFYGRSRRTSYGIFFAVTVAAYFVLSLPLSVWSLQQDKNHVIEQMQKQNPDATRFLQPIMKIPHEYVVVALWACGIVLLLLYIAWVALCVRRLHDMNATGWLALIAVVVALIPFLGYLIVSLVLGVWPGSKGANGYGSDPRDPNAVSDIFGRDGTTIRV